MSGHREIGESREVFTKIWDNPDDAEYNKQRGVRVSAYQELRAELRRDIAAWRDEKRASVRWSTAWHRADAAIAVLSDLRRRLARKEPTS